MCLKMALFLTWEVWVLFDFYLLSKRKVFQSKVSLSSMTRFSIDIQK